jgi:F0F1-type ATP synthase membrane subunit b/b'
VSPALANFLFEAVNFLLLAAALGHLLFKPIRRALDAERERHAAAAAEAARLRAEAQTLLAEAQHAREVVQLELDESRAHLLEAARGDAARLLADARKTQQGERESLMHELERMRNTEAQALAEAVGRIAAESVVRLLDTLRGPSLDHALVRAACDELVRLPKVSGPPALVESARPLDGESRTLITDALGSNFLERVVAELEVGVRVTTPAGQVDATAASIARRAALALSLATEEDASGHAE